MEKDSFVAVTANHQVMPLPMRPRFEGANIRTWVGFKHLMYLAEEAVVQWFRQSDMGLQHLYNEYGLGLEIVDSSVLLPALLEIDDEVVAEVTAKQPGRFSVRLLVEREGSNISVLKGNVKVALVQERSTSEVKPVPLEIAPLVVSDVTATTTTSDRHDLWIKPGEDERSVLIGRDSRAFLWSWRARYFHCHYSDRVQHSGYLRALEEVVDRFLVDRGISVRRMLDERGWIPVVSRARVQLVADAHMEETIHTTFVVEDVLKGIAYDARMDCYVRRGEMMVHTATARILHGYAVSHGEAAGRLTKFDESTLIALTAVTQL